MFPQFVFRWSLVILLVAQGTQGQDASIEQFERAGKIICAWEEGRGEEAMKFLTDRVGLKIVRGYTGTYAVCTWSGKLNVGQLTALKANRDIRYIEPVVRFYADLQPPTNLSPITDDLRAEFAKSGKLVCAWFPGEGDAAIKACREMGFKILRGDSAANRVVCTWDGELKDKMIEALIDSPAVRYIEPTSQLQADPVSLGQRDGGARLNPRAPKNGPRSALEPRDTEYSRLWGLKNIGADDAWESVQASDAVIAVCDTGVDYAHEDLQANIWRNPNLNSNAPDLHGADFIDEMKIIKDEKTGKMVFVPDGDPADQHYHGTHVAGTVGAVGNNAVGVTGVVWRCQIMAVRCLDENGSGENDQIASAVRYAVDHGARVINLSLGGPSEELTLKEAIAYAQQKGVVVVCSAGNVGPATPERDNDKVKHYPSSYGGPSLISVANIDIEQRLSPGSHFGAKSVHLGAPGSDIYSTFPMTETPGLRAAREKGAKFQLRYESISGTSMAAPHVAGAVALLLGSGTHSKASAKDAKAELEKHVRTLASLNGKCTTNGCLDISFLHSGGRQPVPVEPQPPVVYVPPQPREVYCPPPLHCPQFRYRIFGRCRR